MRLLAVGVEITLKIHLERSHVGGSPTASHFLLFVQKKVTQEKHTPHLGLRLPCVAQQSGHPSKLALAAYTLRKPPRNSNSRWPNAPHFVFATQRDGMGFILLK